MLMLSFFIYARRFRRVLSLFASTADLDERAADWQRNRGEKELEIEREMTQFHCYYYINDILVVCHTKMQIYAILSRSWFHITFLCMRRYWPNGDCEKRQAGDYNGYCGGDKIKCNIFPASTKYVIHLFIALGNIFFVSSGEKRRINISVFAILWSLVGNRLGIEFCSSDIDTQKAQTHRMICSLKSHYGWCFHLAHCN